MWADTIAMFGRVIAESVSASQRLQQWQREPSPVPIADTGLRKAVAAPVPAACGERARVRLLQQAGAPTFALRSVPSIARLAT